MIPLDKNESYWLLDTELQEVVSRLSARSFSTYPAYEELKENIAAYTGVRRECVCVTPGSDAAILHIVSECIHGGSVVLPTPSFYGYESILDRAEVPIVSCTYTERNGTFVFPLEEVITTCTRETPAAVFLCHPNNPLGVSLQSQEIQRIADLARHSTSLFVSDEAYFEFSEQESFGAYVSELPNFIILRTFSKSFALAGARIGFVLTTPERVCQLERRFLPWPIAHASVIAANLLLEHVTEVHRRIEQFKHVRSQFIDALRLIPHTTVYPSQTNFVLIRVPDAQAVREFCLSHGIRVALGDTMSRVIPAKQLLRQTLRIAVPAPSDLPYVFDTLLEACKRHG